MQSPGARETLDFLHFFRIPKLAKTSMARTMRAVRRTHRDVRSANTASAKKRVFFWLLFFARAKKSDSLLQGVKALLLI
jgi:hypothetical protein